MVAERSREGVWALIQLVRRERGLHPEGDWPDKFGAWCDRALRENGRWGIHVALNRYFSDEDFRKKSWATRVFITEGVYGARAPPRDEEQEAFYDEPSREAA